MNRPSAAHTRHTVPLEALEAGDVLAFPHIDPRAGVHAWDVWRAPAPLIVGDRVRRIDGDDVGTVSAFYDSTPVVRFPGGSAVVIAAELERVAAAHPATETETSR